MKKQYDQLLALGLMKRMSKGESLEKLHKETGISKATLWRWREGVTFPQRGRQSYHDWYLENREKIIKRIRKNKYDGNYLKVLERDNYKCQACYRQSYLRVHHKDGNQKNNDMDNLITLCQSCHRIVHLMRKCLNNVAHYGRLYTLADILSHALAAKSDNDNHDGKV
jgi:hypothetical protein